MRDQKAAAHRYVEFQHLRYQIAGQVATLAGVATLAASDIVIRTMHSQDNRAISVDCTLTAYQNVRLHELGAAIQVLVAQLVQAATGLEVSIVNVYIQDIDLAPPVAHRRKNQFEHG